MGGQSSFNKKAYPATSAKKCCFGKGPKSKGQGGGEGGCWRQPRMKVPEQSSQHPEPKTLKV